MQVTSTFTIPQDPTENGDYIIFKRIDPKIRSPYDRVTFFAFVKPPFGFDDDPISTGATGWTLRDVHQDLAVRIASHRSKEPGLVFRVDEINIVVSDLLTSESVEVSGCHILSLGATTMKDTHPLNLDFVILETGRIVTLDDMDAAIVEMVSQEIG